MPDTAREIRRVALVTGSAGGIMRGVCVSLARHGFAIAVNYRPARREADDTLAAIRAAGGAAEAFAADVTDPAQADGLVNAAHRHFDRLDVVVCGVGPLLVKDTIETSIDEFRRLLEGNLSSVFYTLKPALPIFRSQRWGRVIAFGMTGSEAAMGERHYAAYAAAKAGVVALVRSLALEEGPNGITCNIVSPGDIRDKDADRATSMQRSDYRNPTMRSGSWEDVGDAVSFLASENASFVNGAVLAVNGGWQGFFAKYARWP